MAVPAPALSLSCRSLPSLLPFLHLPPLLSSSSQLPTDTPIPSSLFYLPSSHPPPFYRPLLILESLPLLSFASTLIAFLSLFSIYPPSCFAFCALILHISLNVCPPPSLPLSRWKAGRCDWSPKLRSAVKAWEAAWQIQSLCRCWKFVLTGAPPDEIDFRWKFVFV
ncbi:hypothetical protein E2C01_081644 [Portunus trituberculatus]|uniref:Uncharacterized protein n=1 Tax=Portunus trituberculatus TaxID=210409 RepID=A0A5B7J1P6_PORTR|nr:hypothetical protein [Portunus trituberculatus]